MGSFEHQGHTADVLVRAFGKDFADCLDGAVKGFTAVVADVAHVKEAETLELFLRAKSPEDMVYELLSELVYGLDTDGFLPASASLKVTQNKEGYVLEGTISGDNAKHYQTHGDIKAATMHKLSVKAEEGCVVIEYVLDL